MRVLFNLLIGFAIFTSGLTLTLSIYPGMLNGLVGFTSISGLWLVLLGSAAIVTLRFWFKPEASARKFAVRLALATLLILIVSYGLLTFYVPRRIAFQLSRPAFERWLVEHPNEPPGIRAIQTQLGLYRVDELAADDSGGRYFRVYSHGDGLAPDTVSYGFAYQPHPERTPFGAARYGIRPLGGKWYWFRVSNDW